MTATSDLADRRGVAAALALGAAGLWVGPRFLAAAEANMHPVYCGLVLVASGEDTLFSALFDIGWPDALLQTLRSSTVARWEEAGRPLPPHRPGEGAMIA